MKLLWLLIAGYLLADSDAKALRRAKEEEPKVLAEAKLPGGSLLKFEEVSGYIVATGTTSEEDEKVLQSVLGDDEDDTKALPKELGPTQLYEKLTGKKAPASLKRAQDRMNVPASLPIAPPEDEDEDDNDIVETDNEGDRKLYISCSDWNAYHCPWGDLCQCRSGNTEIARVSIGPFHSKVYPYAGDNYISHKLWVNILGAWVVFADQDVYLGNFGHIMTWMLLPTSWETHIYRAGSNSYNWWMNW